MALNQHQSQYSDYADDNRDNFRDDDDDDDSDTPRHMEPPGLEVGMAGTASDLGPPTPTSITDRYFDSRSGSGSSGGNKKPYYKKLWFWLVVAGLLLVVGVVGTSVGLVKSKSNASATGRVGVDLPKPELEAAEVNENRNELGEILLSMYTERGMDWTPVGKLDTFQGRALTFVAGSTQYDQLTRAQNIERYALVVFYLATFRQPHLLLPVASEWTSSQNWLSKESVCVWEGVVCNQDDSVSGLLLPNHELSGTLPAELSLLLNLLTIDLTTNYIYMEGADHHFVWTVMPALQELTMDDNYFIAEQGLPSEFRGLQSIQKISLSYNLLQGEFDGALFAELPTLQHLEIESNYIEGPLPSQLITLESLIYLYVRRNTLDISLDELFTAGNLPSIFALWLDANNVGGSIPTSIGLYTDLASLSITEADLTGPLPTEMGQLVSMRRCWLYENNLTGAIPTELSAWGQLQVLEIYDNDLTGTMPMPLCDAVDASEYEFRTLSADCAEVDCAECCTECF